MISISSLNDTHSYTFRQENNLPSQEILNFIELCLSYFALTADCKRKGPARFIDLLLAMHNNGFQLKIARDTIHRNENTDLSVRQISRIAHEMKKYGMLTIISRHKESNTYVLSEMFFNPVVRVALKHLLPALDDTRVSKRKREADEMCAMKVAKNYEKQSRKAESIDLSNSKYDFEVGQEKMSRSLKGIYIIENLSTLEKGYECDDGAVLPYVEFDFDNPSTYTYTGEIETGEPQTGVGEVLPSLKSEFKSESIGVPTKKGSTAMQALPTVKDILPCADKLRSIHPLLHGAIILSAFPEEVVLHADERTLKCKKPLPTALDRWKYFVSVCKGYCAENNIETSWAMTLNIRDRYSIHKDTPMFDENHAPALSPSIHLKGIGKGVPTHTKQVTYEEAIRNNQQLANSAPHINKQEEFSNAISTLEKIAETNPFAAILIKNVQKAQPQTVVCSQSMVAEPVKPFDAETLDIVAWIKSHWDDTLFPHSNKWVHDNIAHVLAEGPLSPQYIDGSFLNGMKRIKMLMVELLKRPKVQLVQDILVPAQSDIDEYEPHIDYSSDPFGDRL